MPCFVAIRAAEAGQRADAGRALVVDDVVRVVPGSAAGRLGVVKAGSAEPRAQLDQHVLERPHVAVRRDHRLADRVAGPSALAIGRSSTEMQS